MSDRSPASGQQGTRRRGVPPLESPRAGPWHTSSLDTVAARLRADRGGLSSAAAQRRLATDGPNELSTAGRISPWRLLGRQFANALVLTLLVAIALSAGLGHRVEAVAITGIVSLAVLLGFVQEHRAERMIEAMRRLAAPRARVVRGGVEQDVAAREVVTGDLLVLRAGDRIAADARIVDATDLRTREAALTGESAPVEKDGSVLAEPRLPIGDRRNMVHAGTLVASGKGHALVVATGMRTEFGRVAGLLQSEPSEGTPLQRDLDALGRTLAKVALGIVAVVVLLALWRAQPLLDTLVFGIALAVAVVPEALPAVVTITLALGMQRLLRRRALVRRLAAVETLGATTVICTDKTGTLTRDELTVREILVAGHRVDVHGVGYDTAGGFSIAGEVIATGHGLDEPLTELLRAACLCSDARLGQASADGDSVDAAAPRGDPTELALVVAAAKHGLDARALDASVPRVHELPFSSERKRMTTLHRHLGALVAYGKGAPEVVLSSCDTRLGEDGPVPFDAAARARVADVAQRMADRALRVLAVASKPVATAEDAEKGMTFLGLLGMSDPPRPEAREALQTCMRAGIRVVMITGDHPATARAVAAELDLLQGGHVIRGDDLDAMDDDGLARRVDGIAVFARVSPQHKLRVVEALQRRGHVVAMTGDGVNDAPALEKADVGVAMGVTGTEVAREAAAMTLLDDDFATVVAAVEEGRGTFANVRKCIAFLLASNLGEIGLTTACVLAGLPLPLTAVQILYVNLATDGLPALALAVDPHPRDVMQHRPRVRASGVFPRPTVVLMLVSGAWTTLVGTCLFAGSLAAGRGERPAMVITFVALVMIQFVNAVSFRTELRSALRSPLANRWLDLAIVWELAMLAAIVHVPFLQEPMTTSHLQPLDWLLAAAVATSMLPVLEITKWMARRGWFGRDR